MRIAQVISSCSAGGAEVFVKSLIKQLKTLGNDVELWVMISTEDLNSPSKNRAEFEKTYIKELENANIPVRFIGKRPKKDWIKTSRNLRKLFYDFKPDIVHSHLESVTFHVCRSLHKKAKIVQTIHNTVITHPIIQKYYLKKRIEKFVAISKKVSDIIEQYLNINSRKIETIFNGIDLTQFNKEKLINDVVTKIIAVGRLSKQKDYPNLLEAIGILKKKLSKKGYKIPEIEIVGTGELENFLRRLAVDKKIDDLVDFLGVRNDVPNLLYDSDIYVMSSEWEGLSISLIEALASGIPIVATNAGSNCEIVENNISGLIVPTKNSEALAEGLYRLIINNDLRNRFSKKAKERAKLFSIEGSAEKHSEMYKRIIGN